MIPAESPISHANGVVNALAHLTSNVVLPKPAGADTRGNGMRVD
jgi:hypothetical protein